MEDRLIVSRYASHESHSNIIISAHVSYMESTPTLLVGRSPQRNYFPSRLANSLSELALPSSVPIKISGPDEIARTYDGFESSREETLLCLLSGHATDF